MAEGKFTNQGDSRRAGMLPSWVHPYKENLAKDGVVCVPPC